MHTRCMLVPYTRGRSLIYSASIVDELVLSCGDRAASSSGTFNSTAYNRIDRNPYGKSGCMQ